MLSKDTDFRLTHAVTDEKIADEIGARLIDTTPANESAAQSVLALLDKKQNKSIEERLKIALAGDRAGAAGAELAKKLNGMVAVIEALADGKEIAAVAASFTGQVAGMTTNVTIDADVAGAAGNITLSGDGVSDIDALIASHNGGAAANEQVTLSSGDGSQVPDNGADIVLSGGSDAADNDVAPAKAAMGSEYMSKSTKFALVHALTDQKAADEFESAYNAMIDAVQAIS